MTRLALLPAAVLAFAASLSGCASDAGDPGSPDDDDFTPHPPEAEPAPFAEPSDSPETEPEPDGVRWLRDPDHRGPASFPDDAWTVEDPSAVTGLRIAFPHDEPWFEAMDSRLRKTWEALETLDGWGTTGGIVLRFDGPLGPPPAGLEASLESETLQLWELGPGPPKRLAYEVLLPDGESLLVRPLWPLRPATRHGLVVARSFGDAGGGLLEPLPEAPSAREAEVLLEAGDLDPSEQAAVLAFTTQSLHEESLAVAADIAGRDFDWTVPPACEVVPDGRTRCDGAFLAGDYRKDGHFAGTTPSATYELPVVVWLPAEGAGPFPLHLYGHGLAHDRTVTDAASEIAAPYGLAVAGTDAVAHGDHPDAPAGGGDLEVTAFFGVTFGEALDFDPVVLRDGFRQSTWDKLQLVRLLDLHPDVTGDGAPDLDMGDLTLGGESFGGIMAIEPLALSGRFRMAALQLAGGRVTSIVGEGQRFAIFRLLLEGEGFTAAEIDRFFPLLQAVIERGDAANWANRVFEDRLPGAGTTPPHLLLQVAVADDTIPDASGHLLARALGLPHVPPVEDPVPGLPVTGPAPISANLVAANLAGAGGSAVTAGFFQFDRITVEDGAPPKAATHDSTPGSAEAVLQLDRWFETWTSAPAPEIVDPYEALGTPPLER